MRKFSQIRDDSRTEHPFRLHRTKTVRLYAGVSLIALAVLVAGYYLGRPIFSKYRYDRDLNSAERFEKEGDFRGAMLTWEQLNRLHPADPEARRRLAAFYERIGHQESVAVWKEAVELDPDNNQGHLGLARAAIRFGDRETARTALQKLSAEGPNPAEYYRLHAGLALLDRDVRAQEENLAQLALLEPDNARVRLSLAIIRLLDPDGPKAAGARTVLLELARTDQVRMRAVVELLSDIARRWPTPVPERDVALRALATSLTPARGPLLAMPSQMDHIDRLIHYARAQPDPEAEDVISLANWMSLNGQTEAALQWIDTLPAQLADHSLLKTAHAELAIRLGDWARLRRLLLAGAWGPVPTEAVEQAFRVHAQAGSDRSAGIQPGWAAALEAAKSSPAGLRLLLRLAEMWAWPAEYRQVLLTIARTMPRETWAWRRLVSAALSSADSEQLSQVYSEWRLATPGDPVVQVESAIMGHLLGRRRSAASTETAEYVRQQPLNPGAGVAHALALWRERRVTEAAAVLDALPATVFHEPRYALARGVVLAEADRAIESEELLDRAAGERLLPEERALVAAARERNRGTRP